MGALSTLRRFLLISTHCVGGGENGIGNRGVEIGLMGSFTK
jgi:hypothetical protein